MTYRTTTVCSKNEDNLPEVTLEYERTIWDRLLRRPAKTEVYEYFEGWREKVKRRVVSPKKELEIMRVVMQHDRVDHEMKRIFEKQTRND